MEAQHPEELTSANHSILFEKHKLRDERGRHNMVPWGVVHHDVNHLLRVRLASTTLRFKRKGKTKETAKPNNNHAGSCMNINLILLLT